MVGVVEAARWALLPDYPLHAALLVPGACVGLALLAGGLLYFARVHRDFADIV